MNLEERVLKVLKIILKEADTNEITLDSNLREDLELDSLKLLIFINALEKEFSIELNESNFIDIIFVKDVVKKLEKYLGE